MNPLVVIYYFGDVQIEYWEYFLATAYIVILYIYFSRKKAVNIKTKPEYKYFMYGLMTKLLAGVFFSLIYFYYYPGGDTIAYFYSGVAMRNMIFIHPLEYLGQLFGDNSYRAWASYSFEMGRPYQYVFFDQRAFQVVRLSSLLALVTFKSYLVSTLIIASLSYFGIWACYRTMVSYYPQIAGKLAIGFLFLPSVVFWSSSILKDTITFSAVCWWVHSIDEVFIKKRNVFSNTLIIVVSGFAIIMIKPYILMVLFPVTLLWLNYGRIVNMRNVMIRFVVLPLMAAGLVGATLYVLTSMSSQLDKFALDDALTSIQNIHGDMSSNTEYSSNYFDIGKFDGTWTGVLEKFPQAVNAALFRPYIWEAKNPMMVLSGLENLWILALVMVTLFRTGFGFFFRSIATSPLLMMCMTFSLLFALIVGVSTPNFGALVRFRIPMMPFFISSLYIIMFMDKINKKRRSQGYRLDLKKLMMGTSHLGDILKKSPTRNTRRR